MSNLPESLVEFTYKSPTLLEEGIQLLHDGEPQIFALKSFQSKSKGTIVISPGLATRHLHLKEPFIGFQLAKLGYTVLVINTLDLSLYGLPESDPFQRPHLTAKAYSLIEELNLDSKVISLGHSLGCMDLLRVKPKNSKAAIFISPGFKGDKKKFSLFRFAKFFHSLLMGTPVNVKAHGNALRPELNEFKIDLVNGRFLWNLQKYAHGLEDSEFWPMNNPSFVWLGSSSSSDGIIETKQVHKWVASMEKVTSKLTMSIHTDAGHEPGWRNPQDSINLAKEIDTWIQEYVL